MPKPLEDDVERLEREGKTAMCVAVDGRAAGHPRRRRHGEAHVGRGHRGAATAMGLEVS